MKKIDWRCLVAIIVILGLDGCMPKPERNPIKQVQSLAQQLKAASAKQRIKVKDKFIKDMDKQSECLLDFLHSAAKSWRSTENIDGSSAEHFAIEILGYLRYEKALSFFIRHLSVRDPAGFLVSNEFTPHWLHFPCAVALSRLGTVALPSLVEQIRYSDPSTIRFQLSCLVLQKILGMNLASSYIEKIAAKDSALSAKLKAASRFIAMRMMDWDAERCADFRLEVKLKK